MCPEQCWGPGRVLGQHTHFQSLRAPRGPQQPRCTESPSSWTPVLPALGGLEGLRGCPGQARGEGGHTGECRVHRWWLAGGGMFHRDTAVTCTNHPHLPSLKVFITPRISSKPAQSNSTAFLQPPHAALPPRSAVAGLIRVPLRRGVATVSVFCPQLSLACPSLWMTSFSVPFPAARSWPHAPSAVAAPGASQQSGVGEDGWPRWGLQKPAAARQRESAVGGHRSICPSRSC